MPENKPTHAAGSELEKPHMRRAVSQIPALLFAAALVAVSYSASISRAETPAPAVRTQASEPVDLPNLFDAVVDTIDRRFVDVELLKTIDWQARAKAVRSSVLSAP